VLTPEESENFARERPTFFAKRYLDWVAHPAQAAILNDNSQTKIVAAGRRFGKSEMEAVDLLWFAWYHPSSKQFIISHSQTQAENVFAMLYQFAMSSPMVRNEVIKVTWHPFPELILNNGSKILARTTAHDGKYLRGYAAHRVLIDEAAYNKEKVIKEVVMPMLTDYNGTLILISTPMGSNFFYQFFQRGRHDNPEKVDGYKSWQFPSNVNPHLSHSYIEKMKGEMLDLQFRTEYLAEFIDDQTCVFKWEYINDATKDYEESFERQPGHNYYVGVDVAKQHDFTAISVLDGTNPQKCRLVYTERFNNKSYEFVFNKLLAVIMNFQPLKVIIDETGVGAGITEQVTQVIPQAEGFTFSMPAKIALINTLKLGFEQHRIELSESNERFIDELKYYQYDMKALDEKGIVKMSAPSGKFDDCVISLALAFQCCSVPMAFCDVFGVDKPIETDKWSDEKIEYPLMIPMLESDDYGNMYPIR
jgi:phage FluMu gp28-like protein